jgi:4-hydroxybenzoate polyprenyltransferase
MREDKNTTWIDQIGGDVKKGFFDRIWIYLIEMHPPRNFILGVIFFMSAWCGISLLCHSEKEKLMPPTSIFVSGALTITLMLLLLRIMDELKDLETDLLHFPHRPVPRGAVYASDLKILGLFIAVVLVFLNLFFSHAMLIFLSMFCYACLMYKYFFLKNIISRNILFALLTHNPISYLLFLYVAFIYRNNMASRVHYGQIFLLGGVFFCFSMSWEIARKIRHRENETVYQTYSRVMGIQAALMIPAVLSGISLLVIIFLFHGIFSGFTFFYMVAVYLFLLMTFLRFYKKQPIFLNLKSTTEIFIVNIQSIIVIEGILKA